MYSSIFLLIISVLFAGCNSEDKKQVDNIELAKFYAENGTYSLALNLLTQEAAAHPLEASRLLAKIYYDLEYFQEAEDMARKSISVGCKEESCERIFFNALIENRKFDEAEAVLTGSLTGYSKQDRQFLDAKLDYYRNQNLTQLEQDLTGIEHPQGRELLLKARYEGKKFQEIDNSLDESIDYSIGELLVFSKTLYILEKYEKAEKLLTKIRLNDKTDLLSRRKIETVELLVKVNVALGNFSGADIIYSAFLENNKDTGYVIFNRALEDIKTEQYSKAITSIEKMVRTNPGLSQSKILLALAYYGNKDFDLVVSTLEPSQGELNKRSKLILASAYLKTGNPREAFNLLQDLERDNLVILILARSHMLLGEVDQAKKVVTSFKVDSDQPDQLHEYASVLYQLALDKKFIEVFKTIQQIPLGTRKMLVQVFHRNGEVEAARQYVNNTPDAFIQQELAAFLKSLEGDHGQAIKEYLALVEKYDLKEDYLKLVSLYSIDGQYSEALRVAETAFYKDGNNRVLINLVGRLLSIDEVNVPSWLENVPAAHGDYQNIQVILALRDLKAQQSERVVERLSKLDNTQQDSRVQFLLVLLNKNLTLEQKNKAMLEVVDQNYSFQIAQIVAANFTKDNQTEGLAKIIPLIERNEGQSIYSAPILARGYIQVGDFESARKHIEFIEKNGRLGLSNDLFGDWYFAKKDAERALSYYQKNTHLGSEVALNKYFSLKLLLKKGKRAEVLQEAEEYIGKYPSYSAFRLNIASKYIGIDDGSAISHLKVLLKQRPDSPTVLNNYAWLMLEKEPANALKYAKKAHQLNPDNIDVADTYITALHVNGKVEEARQLLNSLLEVYPDSKVLMDRDIKISDAPG